MIFCRRLILVSAVDACMPSHTYRWRRVWGARSPRGTPGNSEDTGPRGEEGHHAAIQRQALGFCKNVEISRWFSIQCPDGVVQGCSRRVSITVWPYASSSNVRTEEKEALYPRNTVERRWRSLWAHVCLDERGWGGGGERRLQLCTQWKEGVRSKTKSSYVEGVSSRHVAWSAEFGARRLGGLVIWRVLKWGWVSACFDGWSIDVGASCCEVGWFLLFLEFFAAEGW